MRTPRTHYMDIEKLKKIATTDTRKRESDEMNPLDYGYLPVSEYVKLHYVCNVSKKLIPNSQIVLTL